MTRAGRISVLLACLVAIAPLVGTKRIALAQSIGGRTVAKSCASAIGGNVTLSKILVICGIPPEVLDAVVKTRTLDLEQLAKAHKDAFELLKQTLDLEHG